MYDLLFVFIDTSWIPVYKVQAKGLYRNKRNVNIAFTNRFYKTIIEKIIGLNEYSLIDIYIGL